MVAAAAAGLEIARGARALVLAFAHAPAVIGRAGQDLFAAVAAVLRLLVARLAGVLHAGAPLAAAAARLLATVARLRVARATGALFALSPAAAGAAGVGRRWVSVETEAIGDRRPVGGG